MTNITGLKSIKGKLLFSVSFMTVLVISTAGLGLKTVWSLEEQLNIISDVVAPTIEEADDLIAGLWESAKVANEILATESITELDTLAQELIELDNLFDTTAKTLDDLVSDPKYQTLIENVLKEQNEFVIHSKDMVVAHREELLEEIKAKGFLDDFDKQGSQLLTMLEEFAIENEEEMQNSENKGDSIVLNGGTAEEVNRVLGDLFEFDYPVVEAALKLQRIIVEMQDTSGEYLAEEDPKQLPQVQDAFNLLAEKTKPHFSILKRLAETAEDKQDVIDLTSAFTKWLELAANDEMLFDSYRDQLENEKNADQLTELLESDVDNADAALEQIALASDTYMDSADDKSAGVVSKAIFIQIAFIVIAIFVGIAMLLLFNKTVIVPIESLSNNLKDIASGDGDLTQRINVTTEDEIGELATRFNEFVAKIHDLVSDITKASGLMNESAGSMSTLIGETTHTIRNQAVETDSVATAVKELSSSATEISDNISNATQLANEANESGVEVKKVVDSSVNNIRLLATEIDAGAKVIQQLNQEAGNIDSVLTTIQGIAEQTNLLALNAAIEAARAGEQGRGFAVVADEVRTLAARTQDSTTEIQTMIERLQSGAANAVNVMENSRVNSEATVNEAVNASSILDRIIETIFKTNGMMSQVSQSATQQNDVTRKITSSVTNIVSSSQAASKSTQEVNQHAGSLNNLGTDLNKLVGQFKI